MASASLGTVQEIKIMGQLIEACQNWSKYVVTNYGKNKPQGI